MKKTINIEEIVNAAAPDARVSVKFLSLLSDEIVEFARSRIAKAEAVRTAQKHSTLMVEHLNLVRTVESAGAASGQGGASP